VARKKISQKTSRKDDLDPTKDQFVKRSISIIDWAVERRRHIGVFLGVALLAAVAAIVVDRTVEGRRADASILIGDGLESFFAPLVPPTDELAGGEEEDAEEELSFETAGARATESLKRFEMAVEDQGGSAIGLMSLVGAAASHLELGEVDEAIQKYEQFLEEIGSGKDAWLRANALQGLGHALEQAGKLDDARARYQELAEQSEGRVKLFARYDEARIAQLQGDRTAAAGILKEVIDSITEDGEYDRLDFLFIEAGERLKVLDPEADVPSLPGGGFGGLEGVDPALLQKFLEAQQAAGGGAGGGAP
jgi:tetratricopeptide (TPR) repeat protein